MTTLTREAGALRLAIAPLRNIEVRDTTGTGGDGSWTMEGYAAVYEQETVLYDGRWFRMREEIARDAFKSVLSRVASGEELVHFNFGHEMNSSMAATDVQGIGGLELSEDMHGLRFFARIDPDDPDAIRLAVKMRRGVVRQASFAFTIASEELVESGETEDGAYDEKWRITEIGHLYDVCACPQGAYPQTEAYVRSLASASLGRSGLELEGHDRRSDAGVGDSGGVTDVAPAANDAEVGAGDRARAVELAQLKARARTAVRNHPKKD